MAVGDPVLPAIPPQKGEPLKVAVVDPRNACALALTGYLERAVFRVWPGLTGEVREFQLNRVLQEWPSPQETLPYPAASIVDATDISNEGHNFTPTILDSTHNEFHPNTVLWKVSELDHQFQVDFWCNTAPDREAIAARIPGLFAPGENRGAVILEGPDSYFCRRVRASLDSYRRADVQAAVYANERRLTTLIRCAIDVVELRCAVPFLPSTNVVVTTEPIEDVLPR